MNDLITFFQSIGLMERVISVKEAQEISTIHHVQKRIGKEFDSDCSAKMFTAMLNGEYSTTCQLGQLDKDILKNLGYKTDNGNVSWKPDTYHK